MFYVRLALGWAALMAANLTVGTAVASALGLRSDNPLIDLLAVLLTGGIVDSALFWAGYGLYHLVRPQRNAS